MTSKPGDRYSIRIGRDAAGPVVAGHDNIVEVSDGQDTAEDGSPARHYRQRNKAEDHGTVFAVTHGDMHIHQTDDAKKPEA